MARARIKNHHFPDTLELFFEDIANLTVIAGRKEYLPLTRRIERGRTLHAIMSQNGDDFLSHLFRLLDEKRLRLSMLCPSTDVENFVNAAASEIEVFLDDPSRTMPLSIATYFHAPLSEAQMVTEEAWQCFYLLALLPVGMRTNSDLSDQNSEEFHAYSNFIVDQYDQCRRTLIEGTLRYVLLVATHYLQTGIPYSELVQEGYFGLSLAAEKYSERQGAHFQQYAYQWIRQRITRFVDEYSRLIRIPIHQLEKSNVTKKQLRRVLKHNGRLPSNSDFAVLLGWLTQDDIHLLELNRWWNHFERMQERLANYRQLFSYLDKPLSAIPIDDLGNVLNLDKTYVKLTESLGSPPDDITLFIELGWLSPKDMRYVEQPSAEKPDSEKIRFIATQLEKARNQLDYYMMVNSTPGSLERTLVSDFDEARHLSLATYLVASDDPDKVSEKNALHGDIEELLKRLDDRAREVVSLRFGLFDGEGRTLEEVGQLHHVTRERIRQIEHKALRVLKNLGLQVYQNQRDDTSTIIEQIDRQLHRRLINALDRNPADGKREAWFLKREKQRIETLMDKHIMHGRKRMVGRGSYSSRAQMCREILEASQKPMHYSAIHDQVLSRLPPEMHYPKDRTYVTLFYRDMFELLGNGVFGLSSWEHISITENGNKVLHHCPRPLLPEAADSRAFFESVMVGLEILKRQPNIGSNQFYAEMLAWAKQPPTNAQLTQSAFDAWYVAGLLEFVDFSKESNHSLQSKMPTDSKLDDVRMYCLDSLCRRVRKMPELLLAVARSGRPTISDIQKVLFGGDEAGFDVPERLKMLAAFEAIRADGPEWRITRIGEAILHTNPPTELPDIDTIDEVLADDDDTAWEDELGLLDL